jgi:hypothetical protein
MKQRHHRIYRSAVLDRLVHLAYSTITFVYVLLISTIAYHLYKLFRTGSWPKVTLQRMLSIPHKAVCNPSSGKAAEKVLSETLHFLTNISVIYVLFIIIALLLLFLKLVETFAAKTDTVS